MSSSSAFKANPIPVPEGLVIVEGSTPEEFEEHIANYQRDLLTEVNKIGLSKIYWGRKLHLNLT